MKLSRALAGLLCLVLLLGLMPAMPGNAAAAAAAETPARGSGFDNPLPMKLGRRATGMISRELPVVYYEVSIPAYGRYTLVSGGLEVKVRLYRQDRTWVKTFLPEMPDGGGSVKLVDEEFTVSKKGTYYLAVEASGVKKAGSFTLTLSAASGDATPAPATPAPTPRPTPSPTPMAGGKQPGAVLPDPKGALAQSGKGLGTLKASNVIRKAGMAWPESAHPYENDTDQVWYYSDELPFTTGYRITFSADTQLEPYFDRLYFYDENNVQLAFSDGTTTYSYFTGTQLAGKTLAIYHPAFYIRLVTDYSSTYYGFRITALTRTAATAAIHSVNQTNINTVRVEWGAVPGAAGYALYRSATSSGLGYSLLRYTTVPYATVTGLLSGSRYYFKVRPFVNSAEGKVLGAYSPYKPITMLARAAITAIVQAPGNAARLTWGAVVEAEGYTVYRSRTSTGTYTAIGSTTARSFTDAGLSSGRYFYKVAAYRMNGGVKVHGLQSAV
ncbi:MAG TPA: hypothetical protein VLA21_00785, partial [Candidatus Limnocylindria bacterium]|nr:hypothetical protein [Candidatus Limnocylindria bacterium]